MGVNSKGLYYFFIKYVLILLGIISLVTVTIAFSVQIGIINKVLLPSNYTEKEIYKNLERIKKEDSDWESLIPEYAKYGVYDEYGKYIYGEFNDEEIIKGKDVLNNKYISSKDFYVKAEQNKKNILIKYNMGIKLASSKYNRYIPNFELTVVLFWILLNLFLIFMFSKKFGKFLDKELNYLKRATEHIKDRDLNFDMEFTKVEEFNEVLNSIEDLKKSLKVSLNKQWELEENKNYQIESIAHDIKTPLTIIKGSSELLMEEENNQLLESIINNSDKIESYVNDLLDSVNKTKIYKEEFSLNELVDDLENLGRELCVIKNQEFSIFRENIPEKFYGNREYIYRGVQNIISNSVEYTKEYKKIKLFVCNEKDFLIIKVIDEGDGFSKEAIRKATDRLYTENNGRNKHYGLGLSIANDVAKFHSGDLKIENLKVGSSVRMRLLKNN